MIETFLIMQNNTSFDWQSPKLKSNSVVLLQIHSYIHTFYFAQTRQ